MYDPHVFNLTKVFLMFSKLNETDFFVLNVKSTGFNIDDEILGLTLLNSQGDVLVDDIVQPRYKKDWPHGGDYLWHDISPSDVTANGIHYQELLDKLEKAIPRNSLVVSYNSDYHASFIPKNFFIDYDLSLCCVMNLSVGFINHHPSYASLSRPLKLRVLADLLELDRSDLDLKKSCGDALLCLRVWERLRQMRGELELE